MSDRYDVIVIGSGLGGLTAGALFAQAGQRVLLVERHSSFGGAATTFKRKNLVVEVGLHLLDGLDDGDLKLPLWRELGILDNIEVVRAPEFYGLRHPGLSEEFVMPFGIDEAIAATCERFPRHAGSLRRYFREIRGLRDAIHEYGLEPHPWWWWLVNGPIFPLRFGPILKYARSTLGDLLESLFGADDLVNIALNANIGYYAEHPHRLAMHYHAPAQGSYHAGGGYYVKGGSQALSDYLVRIITEGGGTTVRNRSVQEVLVEQGRAVGVVHVRTKSGGDPQEARAPVVIGNAAPHVLVDMLPEERREAFLAPYRPHSLSTSLWSVYLGLERPPSEYGVDRYSSYVYPRWLTSLEDGRKNAAVMSGPPGDDLPSFSIVNYDAIDSGLAEDGLHLMVLCGVDRLANWQGIEGEAYDAKKEAWLTALIDAVEAQYPGIQESIVHRELATARTIQRFLNTPGGAVYGFAQQTECAGRHRPGSDTALPGLWLASAFASPGGGFTGAMLAGQTAFNAVQRERRD